MRARLIWSKGIANLGESEVKIYGASTWVGSLSYRDG